ncbi:MAG TPA: hypothetical protein VJ810_10690 [Blastocatellia bacterium]|nr:hypothetical protein [Blastocatellia bacterium]
MLKLYLTKTLALLFIVLVAMRVTGNDKLKDSLPGVEVKLPHSVGEYEAQATRNEQLDLVQVKLLLPVGEYDPFKPSQGVVKCVVINKSRDPIQIRAGYTGYVNYLKAHGEGHRWEMTLLPYIPYPYEHSKEAMKLISMKPGAEQVAFELSLDEILSHVVRDDLKEIKNRIWRWQLENKAQYLEQGPDSPIRRKGEAGFLEKATFWAIVTVSDKTFLSLNDQQLSSEMVVLKIKPSAVVPK